MVERVYILRGIRFPSIFFGSAAITINKDLILFQIHHRRPPTTTGTPFMTIIYYIGMLIQDTLDDTLQCTCPFAMDNSQAIYLFFDTCFNIIAYKVFHLCRFEGVKIKGAVYRIIHRIIIRTVH